MTENKNNQNTVDQEDPNKIKLTARGKKVAAIALTGLAITGGVVGDKVLGGSTTSASAGSQQEQAEDPYTITSPPAEAGEGTDDLVQEVFPNANDLPEGVIKVEQLGKDDSILGEGERIKVSVPDAESFNTAMGLDEPTGPPAETQASNTENIGIVEGPK